MYFERLQCIFVISRDENHGGSGLLTLRQMRSQLYPGHAWHLHIE